MMKNVMFLFFVCGGTFIAYNNFVNILAVRESVPAILLMMLLIGHIGFSFHLAKKEYSQGENPQEITWNLSIYMIVNAVLILLFLLTKVEVLIYLVGLSGGVWILFFGVFNIKSLPKKSD